MKTHKEIISDPKAPVVALLWLITTLYGKECYTWEPLVLKAELQTDLDCELSDLQSDKIQAGITLLTTDLYESNIQVFETINYLINHQHDDMDELNPLEAEELVCGMTEAYLIKHEDMGFSPEIRVYAGQIFHNYGMHKPPKLFPKAIMNEREGNDDDKNAALQEIFDEKLKITVDYIKECTHLTTKQS